MIRLATHLAAAVLAAATPVAGALAAVGTSALPEPPVPVTTDYELDTEMVVHGWVLCVSQPKAEEIARARVNGVEAALAAYERLSEANSCGQFPELRVILRQTVFETSPAVDLEARVFDAAVNLGGAWASGFVISGGVPAR